MLNEGNQIHIFISSSGSGTVNNYGFCYGSDFLNKLWFRIRFHQSKSYGSYGSGSTTLLVTLPRDCCSVPPPPVPLPPPPAAPPALAPSSSPVVPGNVVSPTVNRTEFLEFFKIVFLQQNYTLSYIFLSGAIVVTNEIFLEKILVRIFTN